MRDKDRIYITIKELIHQEGLTIINIFTWNPRASKNIKQTFRI